MITRYFGYAHIDPIWHMAELDEHLRISNFLIFKLVKTQLTLRYF
jgi:hypothetical protein